MNYLVTAFCLLLLPLQSFADDREAGTVKALPDTADSTLVRTASSDNVMPMSSANSQTVINSSATGQPKGGGVSGTDNNVKATGNIIKNDTGGFTETTTGMEFAPVPGSCVATDAAPTAGNSREQTGKKLCVSGFAIGKSDVTVGQFRRFADATGYKSDAERNKGCMVLNGNNWKKQGDANWKNPGFQQEDNHPVVCVSWNDALAFANWMNTLGTGRYRLPTEAEWDYACHSGGKQEGFCGSDNIDSVAWYKDNSEKTTHPVAQKQANGFALFDMSGNVWQWVQDWYSSSYPATSANPQGPQSGSMRVNRGGGWSCSPALVRASYRYVNLPDGCNSNLGFRLVATPQ